MRGQAFGASGPSRWTGLRSLRTDHERNDQTRAFCCQRGRSSAPSPSVARPSLPAAALVPLARRSLLVEELLGGLLLATHTTDGDTSGKVIGRYGDLRILKVYCVEGSGAVFPPDRGCM